MVYKPVLTKRDFVRRFMLGEFGNKGPNWDTLEEYEASGYTGLVHLRNRIAGGPTWYDIESRQVSAMYRHVLNIGVVSAKNLYLAGMAPTHETLFQGEVQQSERGLDLYFSTVRKPMRDSLREGGQQVSGILSTVLLRHYLCPNSLDWLYTLLERYPLHVIEFSTYAVNWGTLPHFNTVFWEVRRY